MAKFEHSQWSGKTDGNTFMQRSLIVLIRLLGVRVIYALMSLVIPFYMLFNQKGYKAMRAYFVKHHGVRGLKAIWHIYRNHYVFGQIVIDRFAMYGGAKFLFEVKDQHLFDDLAIGEKGFITLSSHVGNYELAGYTLHSANKPFNALVFAGETVTITQNRNRMLGRHNIKVIPVKEDMSHLFLLNAALDNGEIVSFPADRVYGSAKVIKCDFLKGTAAFPMGSFAMAVQKDVPVLAIFIMKESVFKYKGYVRPLTVDKSLSTRDQITQLAQSFARELEDIVLHYPYQWFNYYDFWQDA